MIDLFYFPYIPLHSTPATTLLFLLEFYAFWRKTNRERMIHNNRTTSTTGRHCGAIAREWGWIPGVSPGLVTGENLILAFNSCEAVTTQFYNKETHYTSLSFRTIWKSAVLRFSTFFFFFFNHGALYITHTERALVTTGSHQWKSQLK